MVDLRQTGLHGDVVKGTEKKGMERSCAASRYTLTLTVSGGILCRLGPGRQVRRV